MDSPPAGIIVYNYTQTEDSFEDMLAFRITTTLQSTTILNITSANSDDMLLITIKVLCTATDYLWKVLRSSPTSNNLN